MCIVNIALLIPAYNEAPNIQPLFEALDKATGISFSSVVVVDNGSTDETADLARAHGAVVLAEPRRGYGAACLCGLSWLDQQKLGIDAVLFLDADLSDDPAAMRHVLAPIEAGQAELVIGSRVRLAQPGSLNFIQRFGNRIACTLMYWTTGKKYSDLGPMRCVTSHALKSMSMRDQTWGWTVEMQMKAALLKLRVQEVDVPYRRRHAGRSKISGTLVGAIRAGWKITTTIIILWWGHRRSSSS